MTKRRSTCLALLLAVMAWRAAASPAAEVPRFVERTFEGGRLKFVKGLPVMILQGTPEQIGRQHAELVANAAKSLMSLPKQILQEHGVANSWPLVAAASRTLLSRVSPEHRAELDAIVKTTGIDRDALAVANTMLELRRLGGCSAFVAQGGRSAAGGPLFGRNFDFPTFGALDRLGLITVVRPQGKHAFVSVGFPGLVGVVSGINDAGLAVATLDVYSAKDGSPMFDPTGTPLTFSYRRVLEECTTVAEAEKLLRKVKPTTWSNLTVCDKHGAAVFELTPKHLVVRRGDDGVLACTNHFRTPELSTGRKCRRFAIFEAAMDRPQFGAGDVARLMHAVNQGEMTIHTMIFEPVSLRLHVAMGSGPISARPLNVLELAPLLGGLTTKRLDRGIGR